MATPADFMEYIVDQTGRAVGTENISVRKMFGEYAIYYQSTTIGLICDSALFIKVTPVTERILGSHETGSPYPGSKEWYRMDESDLDNYEMIQGLIEEVYEEALARKKTKKKTA